MFDTMKVARKIKEARIARNMTQMNLADAMEVSYQAVSNWERGNSCPDIGKLEQLCQILDISVEELLGTDSASRTLSRIMEKEESTEKAAEPITIEQIQEVAPLLPPADMEKLVEDSLENQEAGEELDLPAIIGLAPFLDEEHLDSLVKRARVHSLTELAGLAPFLSEEMLDGMVEKADIKEDFAGIVGVAPFLSDKTLDRLVRKMLPLDDWQNIAGLAPFLSKKTLSAMVESANPQKDMAHIISLAPFLEEEALDKLLKKLPEDADVDISGLYPFLSQDTLKNIAETLMRGGNLHALKSIVHFL